jgi:hypothetical protein
VNDILGVRELPSTGTEGPVTHDHGRTTVLWILGLMFVVTGGVLIFAPRFVSSEER